jgi:hypothetical protein
MKQLLGMAREKKEKDGPKPIGLAGKNLNLNKFAQPSYPPPSES